MDRMTDEERALLHKAASAYEDEQRKYQSYEQQLLERISELESIIDADVSLLKQFRLEVAGYKERIGQLEAEIKKWQEVYTNQTAGIESRDKCISELEAKLDRVRELPARGTQSVIMIGGYWINRADLMEALADD